MPLELYIILILALITVTVWFFLDIKRYWSNVIAAGVGYFIADGLSRYAVSGISWNTAGGLTIFTEPWLANIFSWYSYFMILMAGFALLRNTILAPSRGGRKSRRRS